MSEDMTTKTRKNGKEREWLKPSFLLDMPLKAYGIFRILSDYGIKIGIRLDETGSRILELNANTYLAKFFDRNFDKLENAIFAFALKSLPARKEGQKPAYVIDGKISKLGDLHIPSEKEYEQSILEGF